MSGEFLHTLSLSRVHRVDDGHVGQFDSMLIDHLEDALPGTKQDRVHDALITGGLRRLEDLVMVRLGEDDPLRVTPGTATQVADERVVLSKATGQHPLVVLPIANGLAGDPALHGRLRDGRSDGGDQAGVHRLGDDEVHPETEAPLIIRLIDLVRHVLLGEGGDGMHGGHLHLVVDGGGADVHGPAEDEGESEDVVDLIRMVAPSGGHDDVGASRLGLGVGNFRVGIGQGKDDGLLGHALQHVPLYESAPAQTDEDVRPLQGFGQIGEWGRRVGQGLLTWPQTFTTGVNVALAVKDRDVLEAHPKLHVEVEAGHGRGPGSADDELDVFRLLASQLECVDQCRPTDDRRAVLVVVHHRDVQLFLQTALDFERFRSLDVLQVDAPEGGRDGLHGLDERVHVGRVHLDVETIQVGEHLEEDTLAFHDRLARLRTDVAQTENSRSVGDDGNEVALGCVPVDLIPVLGDVQTGLRDSG